MSYGVSVDDLNAHSAGLKAISDSTGLSTSAAEGIIEGIVADVEAEVAAAGVPVPVTDPPAAVAFLRQVVLYGSIASVLRARLPSAQGPGGDRGQWSTYEDRFKARMKRISEVLPALIDGVSSDGDGPGRGSSSYTTRYPDTDVTLGANAEPSLGMNDPDW